MNIASLFYSALNISFTLLLQIQSNIAVIIIEKIVSNNSSEKIVTVTNNRIKDGTNIIKYLVLYLNPININIKPKNPKVRTPL